MEVNWGLRPSLVYPAFGTRLASKTTLSPWANGLSAVISHFNKLSVFHFSNKVKPYSGKTYFVSRLPTVRAFSVLCSPTTLKLTPLAVRVFTSSLKTLKTVDEKYLGQNSNQRKHKHTILFMCVYVYISEFKFQRVMLTEAFVEDIIDLFIKIGKFRWSHSIDFQQQGKEIPTCVAFNKEKNNHFTFA